MTINSITENGTFSISREQRETKFHYAEARKVAYAIRTVCAIVESGEKVITDTQSAIDLMMTVRYDAGTDKIAISKDLITDDFFILSSGLAGEILQKFTNYNAKIAIYGDWSRCTSKPLKDFIYESNKGKSCFFVSTKEEAIQMLAR